MIKLANSADLLARSAPPRDLSPAAESGRRPAKWYAILILFSLLATAVMNGPAGAQADWTTFGFDEQRTGFNPQERVLSSRNVAALRLHWTADLGGPVTAQITLISQVPTVAGLKDVVYAATLRGDVYALEADTGTPIWHRRLAFVPTICSDFSASGYRIGVIATPTIDRSQNALFVVSGDGRLHSLDLRTGEEHEGWPITFLESTDSPLLNFVYGSPTLSGSFLYLATASACDYPPYHGQIVKVSTADRVVTARWFVDGRILPFGGGIWGPGGVSIEPDGSSVYAATGNTLALLLSPSARYGEHVVRLSSDLTVEASNAPALAGRDTDFGATPLLYETSGCPPQLAAMNKSGALFTYYRNLIRSGYAQRLQVSNIANSKLGNFIGMPAFDPVLNRLFLGNPADSNEGTYLHGLLAFDVQVNCMLTLAWQRQVGLNAIPPAENPVISPVVANGVVYYAEGAASQVAAFDAVSGQILWTSGTSVSSGTFASPTVVNGRLFVPSFGNLLYAFGL